MTANNTRRDLVLSKMKEIEENDFSRHLGLPLQYEGCTCILSVCAPTSSGSATFGERRTSLFIMFFYFGLS